MKTSKFGRIASVALATGALLVVLGGCQQSEGPAEHAGKEVDKAASAVGQQIEKAGQQIQDTAKGDHK